MSNVTYLRLTVQQCIIQLYRYSTKTALTKLKMVYNNSLRRLFGLPQYNSVGEMFVNSGILLFSELLRKFVLVLRRTRISVSHKSCLQSLIYTTLKFPFFHNLGLVGRYLNNMKYFFFYQICLNIYSIIYY